MFELIFITLFILVLLFGFVLLFGAPYLPVLRPQLVAALELADLSPGQHLLELGCGDGRVLVAAAEQGITVTGYELNPVLALVAWVRTRKYRKQVRIIWGNFWRKPFPAADGIFVFLLPKYMSKLDKKITRDMSLWSVNPVVSFRDPLGQVAGRQSEQADNAKVYYGVKLVSFAFQIPGKKIAAKKDGVFLYKYN